MSKDFDADFVEMFGEHRQVVFSTALRISGQWSDAEDLTAEAFLRAYRAMRGYSPERIATLAPRAWLVTILLNVWRNSRRSAARRPQPVALEGAPDPADPTEGVEPAAERAETRRELASLLASLPDEQRLAIVLRHVSDLPIAEIARIVGSPAGTVKSHISRGLRQLRELRSDPGDLVPPAIPTRGAR